MPRKDNDFKPTTWTKEINGKTQTRTANTPSDEVFYKFEGWRQETKSRSAASTTASTAASDTKADSKAEPASTAKADSKASR